MVQNGKKPRRTQAERRLATQTAIMNASVGILVTEGYARFSASRVASLAGVSRGAQEHYYPKKFDLIEAVTRQIMEEALGHTRKLTEQVDPARDPIDKFIEDSNWFFSSRSFRAITEIMIAARAEAELADIVHPIVKKTRGELDQIWIEALSNAGFTRESAVEFIDITQHLLRGLFFVDTWIPFPVDRASILSTWRGLANHILLPDRNRTPSASN
ncbi:MAG: hypothetical protein CL534_21550 [Ahrensia sp.]|nr:hypothetical protein [Ahrensia sp.]